MATNLTYTNLPKQKDPFTGEYNYKYLVPALHKQNGTKFNYIVVTCSPSMNGVYRYPASNIRNYKKWNNNGNICLYVPIDDCEFLPLSELLTYQKDSTIGGTKVSTVINNIKKQQSDWVDRYKNGKPDWML